METDLMKRFIFAATALGLMLLAAGRAQAAVEFNFSYQASFPGGTDSGSGVLFGTPEGGGTYLLTSAIGTSSMYGALYLLPPGPTYENSNGDEVFGSDNLLNLNGSLGDGYGQVLSENGIVFGFAVPPTTGQHQDFIAIWAGSIWGGGPGYTYFPNWADSQYPMDDFAVANFTVTRANDAASVPEPTTLIIWSVLGGCGIAVGMRRRKRTAA
jgi:hypothetical protein